MKMPELPPPDLRVNAFGELEPADRRQFVMGDFFTADQLRAYGALAREECAKLAESFATCPCNGQHGRCMENDPPRSIAAAIREQK